MNDQKQIAMKWALSAWKKLKEIHLADIETGINGIASPDWVAANCEWLDAKESLALAFCMSEDLVMMDFDDSKTPEILELEEKIALHFATKNHGGSEVFFS